MKANCLALDTNLFVLLVVGQIEPSFINRHKRLRSYSEADYELLTKIISGFRSLVATPNALSEVSNLVVYGVAEPFRTQFMLMLGHLSRNVTEVFIPSADVSKVDEFVRLGITDSAWLEGLRQNVVLLTDDQHLYLAAVSRGHQAYFFRQVREFGRIRS